MRWPVGEKEYGARSKLKAHEPCAVQDESLGVRKCDA